MSFTCRYKNFNLGWNHDIASKIVLNTVTTFLKDLLNSDKPFGNIIVIISRDFRQTLLYGMRIVWHERKENMPNKNEKRIWTWGLILYVKTFTTFPLTWVRPATLSEVSSISYFTGMFPYDVIIDLVTFSEFFIDNL